MELPFERAAMQKKPLPKGLDIADSCLYVALKNLYAMYYNKMISREDATKEKQTLIFNWTNDKSKIEFLGRESKALKDKIDDASSEYAKEPTIENAERLYCALYNLPANWREQK